ncbi:hypothetical protein [Ferviditalea candida]|uniref:Type II secretion system protein GspF domain-containing protein n=1 Tax=Ferviditalea candida TaxID=3108399 RepID=A0ABU5ZIX2_9BACL|nr:hypothetical protein [Paenibacillaceae bacterium T2]
MSFLMMTWIIRIGDALVFMLLLYSVRLLLLGMTFRRPRWALGNIRNSSQGFSPPYWLLRLLLIPIDESKLAPKRQLLTESGFSADVIRYELLIRLAGVAAILIGILGYWLARKHFIFVGWSPYSLEWFAAALLLLLFFDSRLLSLLKQRRSRSIVNEVYLLSRQLLYFSGSSMNLHHKLVRCVPLTKAIRPQMNLLVNEWYQDAERAIERFAGRLATEEGRHFAETLRSLRLYDHEQYYEVLRQRTKDYKHKIELIKESRKEMNSYVLFVLAGIPILNTFRIFIYPWLAEGRKLFDMLG